MNNRTSAEEVNSQVRVDHILKGKHDGKMFTLGSILGKKHLPYLGHSFDPRLAQTEPCVDDRLDLYVWFCATYMLHKVSWYFSTVDASSLEDDPSNKAQRSSSLHAFSKNNLVPSMNACALEQCTCWEPIVRTSVVSSKWSYPQSLQVSPQGSKMFWPIDLPREE